MSTLFVVIEKEVGWSKGTRSQIECRTSVSVPKQDVRVKGVERERAAVQRKKGRRLQEASQGFV